MEKKIEKVPKKVTEHDHSQHCYDLHASILYGHMTEHSPTLYRPDSTQTCTPKNVFLPKNG